MRRYTKVVVVLVVFCLICASCSKKEVFRIDVSKTRKTVVERQMDMNVSVTVNMPVGETEMGSAKIVTVNKLKSIAENLLDLKDSQKPGFFESSEKILSADYHISQRRDESDEMSITMSHQNGKITVVDKKDDEQGRFEASARQAMSAMVRQSDLNALMEVGSQGEIKNIIAGDSVKKGLELSFQKTAGIFGVVFPEKAVRVGDSWQEKRMMSDIEGVDISKNPIELTITSKREEDEKLNGKDMAVFTGSYKIEKNAVPGIFGGFPTTVDISDSGTFKNYYSRKTKTFVKTVVDTRVRIVSSKEKNNEKSDSSVIIDIENNTASVTTEKVD